MDPVLLMPKPFRLSEVKPAVWFDAASGVVTHGSRLTDGTDQRFTVGTAINPATADFHFSGWLYLPSYQGSAGYIFATGATGNGVDGFALYQPTTSSGALLRLYFNDSVQGVRITADTSAVFAARTWSHIAINFDRSGNATMHLNGNATPVGTLDISGHAGSLGAATNGSFGTQGDGTNKTNFAFCCWGYGTGLLSTDDITTLYNRGVPLRYAELPAAVAAKMVYYWNFDETDGTANATESVAANHGVPAGTSADIKPFGSPQRLAPANGLLVGNWWTKPPATSATIIGHVAASRPTYHAASQGVVFDGTNHHLFAIPNLFAGTACEGAIVFTTGSTAFADRTQTLFCFTGATLPTRYGHVGIDGSGCVFVETNVNGTVTRVTGDTGLLVETQYGLSWDSDGSAWSLRIIGNAVDETLTPTGSNSGNWAGDLGALDRCYLGVLWTSEGGSNRFEGTIHQLMVATSNKVERIETKLRNKLKGMYGLSLTLGLLLADGSGILMADGTGLILRG